MTSQRKCGDCTLCCTLVPVEEIAKRANTKCKHQFSGGCRVYHKRNFPMSCHLWNCGWLTDDPTALLRRPDRTHYVIDVWPDIVKATRAATGETYEIPSLVVWCDPAYKDAWQDPSLPVYALSLGYKSIIVRYNSWDAINLFYSNEEDIWILREDGETVHTELTALAENFYRNA